MAQSLSDIVDELDDMEGDRSVGDVIETLAHRGAAPFLIVPPLVELSPVGALPGLPTVLALIIAIFAVQILLGHEHLWAPDRLRRRSLPDDRFEHALSAIKPWAKWLDDRLSGKHLSVMVSAPARRVAAAIVVLLCLVVPPLELIPWGSSMPMGAILCIGLALLFRNGLLMLLACALSVSALWAVVGVLT